MPADHLQALKMQRVSAEEILKASRTDLDKEQVKEIRCEITRIKADISKFSVLVKGGSNGKTKKKKS
jgi:hypothetical protein